RLAALHGDGCEGVPAGGELGYLAPLPPACLAPPPDVAATPAPWGGDRLRGLARPPAGRGPPPLPAPRAAPPAAGPGGGGRAAAHTGGRRGGHHARVAARHDRAVALRAPRPGGTCRRAARAGRHRLRAARPRARTRRPQPRRPHARPGRPDARPEDAPHLPAR